ncbi:MAG: YggT family protein [Halieaceae bacterium]|jgi:YggT family protein|nr:YggT family protein [Halieaceae bacterium]MBT7341687.1 YggT family protein [Halieaceae bacterium]
MAALNEIARYLLETAASFYLILTVLRGMLQLARADFYNPISQFVVRATNPPLRVIHRVIPSAGRFDPAVLILAVLVQVLAIVAQLTLSGFSLPDITSLLIWSVLGVVGLIINTYLIALVVMIVISWVAPGTRHPAVLLTYQITEPIMSPVRSMLPSMGGLDFSPIVIFIAINMIQIALSHMATAAGLPLQLVMGI